MMSLSRHEAPADAGLPKCMELSATRSSSNTVDFRQAWVSVD